MATVQPGFKNSPIRNPLRTRLNRTVAIKVLSAHFSDDAEMKARFEREAQTIAESITQHITGPSRYSRKWRA